MSKKISELPSASLPLDPTAYVALALNGVTYKGQVKDIVSAYGPDKQFLSSAGDFQFSNTETDFGLTYTAPFTGTAHIFVSANIGFGDMTKYCVGNIYLKKNNVVISSTGTSVSNQISASIHSDLRPISFFESISVVEGDVITVFGINATSDGLIDAPVKKMMVVTYRP